MAVWQACLVQTAGKLEETRGVIGNLFDVEAWTLGARLTVSGMPCWVSSLAAI